MQHTLTRLENFCVLKEMAVQKFLGLLPTTSNIDHWVASVLSTSRKSKKTEIDFASGFQARFTEFYGFLCEILSQHKIQETAMNHVMILFLFYFAPDDARDYLRPARNTARYLEYRAREIVAVLQSFRGRLLKHVGFALLSYLYSSIQLFYNTCVLSTIKATVQMELVEEAELLMRDILSKIHDISTGRKAVTSEKDGNVVALALSKACMKIVNVVCALLNRNTILEVQAHMLFLAILRCHGITSGRLFAKGTQLGDYEDQTAARFSRIFIDVCCMVDCQVFTCTVLPTEFTVFNRCVWDDFPNPSRILRIDKMILFQLADSVEFYLDCIRTVSHNFCTLAISYDEFKPEPWDLVGVYDKRIFLDLVQPMSQTLALKRGETQPAPDPDCGGWLTEACDVETI